MAPGFDRTSLLLLAIFFVVGLAASIIWREHVSLSLSDADPLLWACWVAMAALAMYRIQARRDAALAGVGLLGGALIEAWGTRAGLWVYFTGEQPPLFILPAWPAAALATERVARALEGRCPTGSPRAWGALYIASLLGFAAWLAWWVRPGWGHPLTWLSGVCVAITALGGDGSTRRGDMLRLAAGTLVGYPLEYWGTSRACWVYWSGEVPPLIAVLSHGFATLAFARGAALVERLLPRPRPA